MKVLLFGGSGQIGWELRRALAPLGEVVTTGRAEADFERPESLATVVRATAPDVVVNAAGHTDVDRAEREPERAQRLNADAPAVLAREAAARDAWLVHYSSDYVFDGSGEEPRNEEAPMAPLNAYGRSKRDGEIAVRTSGCRHLIVRTSWIHAPRRDNFVTKVLRLVHERARLEVVDDQVGAPTGADLVADLTAHMLRTAIGRPDLAGTYHAAASGVASRLECARHVAALARRLRPGLPLDPGAIDGVATAGVAAAAARPLNSRLDTHRLCRAFGLALPPWQAGVERTVAEALAVSRVVP
jgi:dTDP-4-dehydrorhamnose reductase